MGFLPTPRAFAQGCNSIDLRIDLLLLQYHSFAISSPNYPHDYTNSCATTDYCYSNANIYTRNYPCLYSHTITCANSCAHQHTGSAN